MKISEIKKIVIGIIKETLAGEGVGYVYDKDRKKDPKSIPGEHWRIKFQSDDDLKKHGNTEMSSVKENKYINKKEVKSIIKEIIDEMWADLGTTVSGGNNSDNNQLRKPTGRITEPGADKNLVDLYKNGGKSSQIGSLPSSGGAMSETKIYKNPLGKEHEKSVYDKENKKVLIKIPTFNTHTSNRTRQSSWISMKDDDMTPLESARYNIIEKLLKKGLSISNAEKAADRLLSKPKKINENNGIHKISKPVKIGDEWVVKWMTNGKRDENKTYYTDDRKDAFDTYAAMVRHSKGEKFSPKY